MARCSSRNRAISAPWCIRQAIVVTGGGYGCGRPPSRPHSPAPASTVACGRCIDAIRGCSASPHREPSLGPMCWHGTRTRSASRISRACRGADVVGAVSLLDTYARGAAQAVVEAEQATVQTGASDDDWWRAHHSSTSTWRRATTRPAWVFPRQDRLISRATTRSRTPCSERSTSSSSACGASSTASRRGSWGWAASPSGGLHGADLDVVVAVVGGAFLAVFEAG